MLPNKPVTGQQEGDAVVEPTSAASEVPAQGTPAQMTSDATPNPLEELQARLDKLEEDRRKQQAVYDRKLAEAEKRNQALVQQLDEARRKTMTEDELRSYEAAQYKERYEQLLREREEEQMRQGYLEAFSKTFDVPAEELASAASPDELVNKGWQLAAQRFAELKERLASLEQGQTRTTQPPTQPQKVITGSGVAPRGTPTEMERRQYVAQALGKSVISEDEYYSFIERHPDLANQWFK